jgi:hypothetical protein
MTTPDTGPTDLWPFNPNTNIFDRETAAAIRRWALSETGAGMTEAELRSYSQCQLLSMYVTGYLEPTLRRLLKPQRPPEVSEAGANRALFGKEPPTDRAEFLLWQEMRGMEALRASEGKARSANSRKARQPRNGIPR